MFQKHIELPRLLSQGFVESYLDSRQRNILDSLDFKNYLEGLFAVELLRSGVENFEFEKKIIVKNGQSHRTIDFYFSDPISLFFVEEAVQNIEIKQEYCDKARMRDQHAQLAEVGNPTIILSEVEIRFCQTWGLCGDRSTLPFSHDKKILCNGDCYLCRRYAKRKKKQMNKLKKWRDSNSKKQCNLHPLASS